MSMNKYLFCLVSLLTGCVPQREALQPVILKYVDLGFEYQNPYDAQDFAAANELLAHWMIEKKLDTDWEAYFIPMQYVNRLVIIPVTRQKDMPDGFERKLERDLKQFLSERLQAKQKGEANKRVR